jgi:hypothetical protein
MLFVDRREQLLAEAGRWVKGGTCKIKGLTIGVEVCHWSHHFSWKAGEICPPSLYCSIGFGVVFDPRSHTRYPPYELMSHNWYVSLCWTWYQEKRGTCRSIPDEKSKTIPVPGGAVLSSFRIESQLCPGPRAISVLIVRKIQHAQIDSFPVVLSLAYPLKSVAFTWTRILT